MNNSLDLIFLKTFFSSLQSKKIQYCILRNVEEVKQGDAHDVDMSIDAEKLQEAEELLIDTAQSLNWNLHLKTGSSKNKYDIKCYHFYYINEQNREIHIVHLDIFPTFQWKGYELLSNKTLLTATRSDGLFLTTSAEAEAICNLFTRLLFNGYIKDKYKDSIQKVFIGSPDTVHELLRHFLSQQQAKLILQHASNGQWERIIEQRRILITDIKRTAKRHIFSHLCYLMSKAINRKGLIIAFQGTDGSGKSTIINGLPSIIGNSFTGSTIDYYHWRPGFIHPEKKYTRDGKLLTNVQPHNKPPMGKLASLAKLAFYSLDYLLGYVGRVYWQAAKGHLVIFDRYYYDFYMDKLRYRLSISDGWVRFFQFFIPKPDITFLLIGDAKQIYERKRELTVADIQEQIDTLLKYRSYYPNAIIANVNTPIPHVLYQVSQGILDSLKNRN